MTPDVPGTPALPEPVRVTLDEFVRELGLGIVLRLPGGDAGPPLYPRDDDRPAPPSGPERRSIVVTVAPREGPELELEVGGPAGLELDGVARLLRKTLERTYDFAQEIRFFTYEVAERYEEINLLYSISETLGSILHLDDAARVILQELL
ncbi:MAG TPA: hypothetical protein VE173_12565, partial [Longimicrobiales bacterium]|nr:hypothetical protein [Longimicrobiales bacterium]